MILDPVVANMSGATAISTNDPLVINITLNGRYCTVSYLTKFEWRHEKTGFLPVQIIYTADPSSLYPKFQDSCGFTALVFSSPEPKAHR